MTTRRGFLAACLAACAAPAIVRASSLMILPPQKIINPNAMVDVDTVLKKIWEEHSITPTHYNYRSSYDVAAGGGKTEGTLYVDGQRVGYVTDVKMDLSGVLTFAAALPVGTGFSFKALRKATLKRNSIGFKIDRIYLGEK